MKFTKYQISNWRAFERVRVGGRYNMFDPNARAAAGLDREEFMFVMKNYEKLREAASKRKVAL